MARELDIPAAAAEPSERMEPASVAGAWRQVWSILTRPFRRPRRFHDLQERARFEHHARAQRNRGRYPYP